MFDGGKFGEVLKDNSSSRSYGVCDKVIHYLL